MAYKRELIVNNGSLTSYKKLLKVSDVCQLLDKRTFNRTTTISGVTCTNNGDGTFTLSGTATQDDFYNCTPEYPKENNGHIFYVCANNATTKHPAWGYGLLNQGIQDNGGGVIGKTRVSDARRTGVYWYKTVVFDNVIIKPQIIDLTEMYGAGNEPATVEEFKAKFPNELYPYSPRCWVTSYKTGLIAKTKNLFNLATASAGYIQWEGNLNHSEDTVTYPLSSDYLECTPNTSYTISAFCGKHPVTNDSTLWCRIAYYDENKQILTRSTESSTDTNIDYVSVTASAPTNAKYLRASTSWMSPTYREQHPENWVMLEKGTTATDYVPFGYL